MPWGLRCRRRSGNIAIDVIRIASAQQPSWGERSAELGLSSLALLGTRYGAALKIRAARRSIRIRRGLAVLVNLEPGERTVECTIVPHALDAGLQNHASGRRQDGAVRSDLTPIRLEYFRVTGVHEILPVDVVAGSSVWRYFAGVRMNFRLSVED